MRRLADLMLALAAALLIAGTAFGLAWTAGRLRPVAQDGRRYEPPAAVGAAVVTEHGEGVITARIRYAEGYRWQIRLSDGRHVVLHRAAFRVVP